MMSDDMLSQDEIDALLRGNNPEEEQNNNLNVEEYLSFMEQDALGEIGNISFGSSATALSTLLNQKVEITTPTVTIVHRERIPEEFPDPYVAVQVHYTEGFSGTNMLVIQQNDAAVIADLMLGGDGSAPRELMDEIQLSAVQEAMNQMMGSAATSMSTVFSKRVDISPPAINLLNLQEGKGTESIPSEEVFVKVSFRLKIGSLIDSSIMQLFPVEFARSLINELLNPGNKTGEQKNDGNAEVKELDFLREEGMGGIEQPSRQPERDFQNEHQETQHLGMSFSNSAEPQIQPAVFSSFDSVQPVQHESQNLDMLLDIPLEVTVELGRTKRSVRDILELSGGSIIELDKLAGEQVDILVNNRLVAKGEVVVIDENFGVRVSDIISKKDRLRKLK
ncbi:flagellar motor switch phosphatase FliY [Bacillus massilinigeriensis]|uniref:flagellar motor switch phosphatase FliY n=1 Tax=Bacillus mediterraneensis TaxID=1805474 RepID=UPI0008F8EEE8|nr:flagellar motor switch phosphatase FliY [Bacillus mediterraneensis]